MRRRTLEYEAACLAVYLQFTCTFLNIIISICCPLLGKEFKALFISTVRTMWTCSQIEDRNLEINSDLFELDFGFLSDPRLLNTAVTRAQSLLAVVGDPMSLCSVGECTIFWKDYLKRCDANKGLYGCTLRTVMDFCLSSQALDPTAHEFIPGGSVQMEIEGNSAGSSSKGSNSFLVIDIYVCMYFIRKPCR